MASSDPSGLAAATAAMSLDANAAAPVSSSAAAAAAPSAAADASAAAPAAAAADAGGKKPTVCIVIGMAGSGKTTLMQRILSDCQLNHKPAYCLNLDPAVGTLPYQANIDIRDTVNYKQVMKQYNLGPNGGILTALNLFATRFDQVLGFVDKRAPELDLVLLDTPGQIEIFTWSASGSIISESLASTYPTVILYVVDTPRTTSPVTFMSNMMYACSIMYKSKLPFLLVFNKSDVTSPQFAQDWMADLDAFTAALKSDESYMSSLTRSMSLVLDEFYATIRTVGVSAMTGAGMGELFAALADLTKEYDEVYKPALEAQKADVAAKAAARKQKQMERMARDMAADAHAQRGEKVVLDGGKMKKAAAAGAGTAADRERAVPLGRDGIIQQRSMEQRSFIRHADEEAELSDDDEDQLDDADFADEADAETREYEEEGGDDEEYADDAAAEADRREFDEFMAKIKGGQGQAQGQAQGGPAVGAGVGAAAAAAARRPIPEEEDDEGAEEIDTEKKHCC